MTYLVGMDEAGYGPNLGPLVVSATAWSLPEDAVSDDLYRVLHDIVAPGPMGDGRLALADSKALYSPSRGLGLLEQGLLAALSLLECRPATWREYWRAVCPAALPALDAAPWHADYDEPLPLAQPQAALHVACREFNQRMAASPVRLVAVRSRVVFPEEWNRLCRQHANKATALSHLSLELLAEVLAQLGDSPVSVVCDKHGGRSRYRALLQEHFPDAVVEVYDESADESRYRWGPPHRRSLVCFRAKGERYLPAALASMASKYLRELSMRAFNAFWRRHLPGLRPTAGYPTDARRFMADTLAARTELGIDDDLLWRVR